MQHETLHLQLLGRFHLTYGGQPVTTVTSPRLQSLCAYLVLHRDTAQPRHHLAFLFWPESPEPQAFNSLRNLLYQLRSALPDADRFVQADAQTIQWRPQASFNLDVAGFEEAKRRAQDTEDQARAGAALERAVSLYQGDLLPSCYDDWIVPERERLRRQYVGALETLIALLEGQRNYRAAIEHARTLLQYDPLHEPAYRQLMRLLALAGDRARALRVYQTCIETLQQELGVTPDAETQAVFQRLLKVRAPSIQPLHVPAAAPVLVGRDQEWKQLQEAWAGTTTGGPGVVLVTGEAGIGKTHLTEAMLQWVERQGISAASARSYAAEGELAYAPVLAWLRSGPVQAALDGLERIWLVELLRLLPELAAERSDLSTPGPLAERWQRQRLFEAMARAMLAADQPLLLVLDDLQWCDQETLEWLHYLLRFDETAQVLIVLTLRSEAIKPAPLTSFLLSLPNHTRFRRLDLRPLAPAETALLAAQTVGQELDAAEVEHLYQETEGNPLFVVEMVRAARGNRGPGMAGGTPAAPNRSATTIPRSAPLPPKVQAVVESRLAQLSAPVLEVVAAAAVLGREFDSAILAATTQRDEETLAQGLDELWQRHVIRELAGGIYDFSHDKIREVVYGRLSSPRRRFWHRRAGEALAAVHAGDLVTISGQAAAHFEQAGSLDQAFRYYVQAADYSAQIHAYHRAEQFYGLAIGRAGKLNLPGEKLAQIYLARGRMLEHAGQYSEAIQVYRDLEQLAQVRHDRALEGAAVAQLVKCVSEPTDMHDPAQARSLLTRGLNLARELDDPALESQLLWSQMVNASHYGSDQEAQSSGAAAAAIARQHGLDRRLAYVLNDLAINLRLSGEPERGQACADEARTLFRCMDNLPMLADNLGQQAWSDYLRLDFEQAGRYATECIQLSHQIDNGWNLSLAMLVQGLIRLANGEWGQALSDLEESMRFGQEAGLVLALTMVPMKLGSLLRELGQVDRAWDLHLAAQAAGARQAPFLLYAVEAQLAMDAFASGLGAEGRHRLRAMRQRPVEGAIARAWLVLADPALATVSEAEFTGEWEPALEAVEQALAEAQRRRLPIYLPELACQRGRCLAAAGREEEAESALVEAVVAAQAAQLQPVLWRAHALLYRLYHQQGRAVEAAGRREAAVETVQGLAASLPDPVQRSSFLATPPVQELLAG